VTCPRISTERDIANPAGFQYVAKASLVEATPVPPIPAARDPTTANSTAQAEEQTAEASRAVSARRREKAIFIDLLVAKNRNILKQNLLFLSGRRLEV
jgi:hypothetical protein